MSHIGANDWISVRVAVRILGLLLLTTGGLCPAAALAESGSRTSDARAAEARGRGEPQDGAPRPTPPAPFAAPAERRPMTGFEEWLRGQFTLILREDRLNAVGLETATFAEAHPELFLYIASRGEGRFPGGALAFFRSSELAIYVDKQLLAGKEEEEFMGWKGARQRVLWVVPTFIHEVTHAMDYAVAPAGLTFLESEAWAEARTIRYLFERRRNQPSFSLPRGQEEFDRAEAEWRQSHEEPYSAEVQRYESDLAAWKPGPESPEKETARLELERRYDELQRREAEVERKKPAAPWPMEFEEAEHIKHFRKGFPAFYSRLRHWYPAKDRLDDLVRNQRITAGPWAEAAAYYRSRMREVSDWIHQDKDTY